MAIVDTLATPLAERLLTCLDAQVQQLESPPRRVGLRPGNRVDFLLSLRNDECCEGMAWVRVDRIFPSSATFPNQDAVPVRCGQHQFAVALELGIVRCAPITGANSIPSPDTWNNITAAILADFAAMQKAICCFQLGFRRLVLEGAWEPLAVEGRCVGGTMTVTVAAQGCNCQEDESPS